MAVSKIAFGTRLAVSLTLTPAMGLPCRMQGTGISRTLAARSACQPERTSGTKQGYRQCFAGHHFDGKINGVQLRGLLYSQPARPHFGKLSANDGVEYWRCDDRSNGFWWARLSTFRMAAIQSPLMARSGGQRTVTSGPVDSD